jgi:hypothetical protein
LIPWFVEPSQATEVLQSKHRPLHLASNKIYKLKRVYLI